MAIRQYPFIILDSDKVVRFDDIIYPFESKEELIDHLEKKAKVLGAIHSNGKKQSKKNGWKY
tara:strand:- start:816 stop:1001 length:186 start_codon:yes stop_codon:yes gene_type:complete